MIFLFSTFGSVLTTVKFLCEWGQQGTIMVWRASKSIGLALALLVAGGASAQQAAVSDDDLRIRQEKLFEAMLAAPDNLDVMFEHALTSIALKDYEAAISTLERLLIFNPSLARAKVELGAAYFRLGAYENARYYFDDVLTNDNPPDDVRLRITAFMDEIGRRTQKTGAAGVATFGLTYSSNANLGPNDANVLLFGAPAVLDPDFVASDDIGARATLNGRHFIDLDQPNGDVWLTDVSIFALHYLDENRGDIDSVTMRTGPRLSLSDETFGPKVRPFIEGDIVVSGGQTLYTTIGIGAEYSDTINDEWNVFASAQSSWREYIDRNDFDGSTHRVNLGATYSPDTSMGITGLVYVETDFAAADQNSNYEFGTRLSGTYRYDSGFAFSDRLWSLSGFVGGSYRRFQDPDPVTSATFSREDFDLRTGVSHIFSLTGGWFVQADADFLLRDSNVSNFDIDNIGVALSVGRSF